MTAIYIKPIFVILSQLIPAAMPSLGVIKKFPPLAFSFNLIMALKSEHEVFGLYFLLCARYALKKAGACDIIFIKQRYGNEEG